MINNNYAGKVIYEERLRCVTWGEKNRRDLIEVR